MEIFKKGVYVDKKIYDMGLGELYDDLMKVRHMCSYTFHGRMSKTIRESIFYGKKGRCFFPREFIFRLADRFGWDRVGKAVVRNDIVCGRKVKHEFETFKMRDYQLLILKKLYLSYRRGDEVGRPGKSVILDLEPGLGKTFIALALTRALGVRTLIIVHSKTQVLQYLKVLGDIGCGSFSSYDSKKSGTGEEKGLDEMYDLYGGDGSIVIGVINSFYPARMTKTKRKWLSSFGLTIYDEVDKYNAPENIKGVRNTMSKYCLGMSGTCYSNAFGMDGIIHQTLGYPLKIDGLQSSDWAKTTETRIVKIRYMAKKLEIGETSTGMLNWSDALNQICKDDRRLDIMYELINMLIEAGRKPLVFVDRLYSIGILTERLNKEYKDGTICDLTESKNKNRYRDALKAVCCISTYQTAGTGFSPTQYDTIIFGTSRKTGHEQYCKRIYRVNDGKRREIYDFVDNHFIFHHHFKLRRVLYEKMFHNMKITSLVKE